MFTCCIWDINKAKLSHSSRLKAAQINKKFNKVTEQHILKQNTLDIYSKWWVLTYQTAQILYWKKNAKPGSVKVTAGIPLVQVLSIATYGCHALTELRACD